jgi:hypothetical protein
MQASCAARLSAMARMGIKKPTVPIAPIDQHTDKASSRFIVPPDTLTAALAMNFRLSSSHFRLVFPPQKKARLFPETVQAAN